MKRYLFLIVFASLFVYQSCVDNKVDHHVLLVDSLIQVPDKDGKFANSAAALKVINSINPDSLTSDREKAIFGILVTQMKFKNGVLIDSACEKTIDESLDYFRRHKNDGNYLGRSLIFKGYVEERLANNGDSVGQALKWYNEAIDNLPADDKYWHGYAHFRIANLLSDNWNSDSSRTRDHNVVALKMFEECGDSIKAAWCNYNLGCHYFREPNDSALYYLNKVLSIPIELNDTFVLAKTEIALCSVFHTRKNYSTALYHAKRAIELSQIIGYQIERPYYYLASCYARLGQIDSARWAIEKLGSPRPDYWLDNFVRRDSAEAVGDYKKALFYADNNFRVRTSELESVSQKSILRSDLEIDNAHLEADRTKARLMTTRLWMLFLLAVSFVLALIVIVQRQRKKQNMSALKMEMLRNNLSVIVNSNRQQTETLQGKLSSMLKFLSNFEGSDGAPISEMSKTQLGDLNNDEFYSILRDMLDIEHDGIMSIIEAKYPKLKKDDFMLIGLFLNRYPLSVISAIMGYGNSRSVYTKRKRLEDRMGIKSIEELAEGCAFKEES